GGRARRRGRVPAAAGDRGRTHEPSRRAARQRGAGRSPPAAARSGALRSQRDAAERAGEERRLEIVGIDEADAANGRMAFTAPIARAILGREVGDTIAIDTPRGQDRLEVVSIDYPAD
ncbi:MAG: GreA/GreB family elongation factor, partial [Vicinamibacteria bacterium]